MGTECEVDAICDGENYLIPGIMEQVERTGVHSGDSICVYPAQHLTQAEIDTMVDYTGRFARELHVNGLVNVQYAVSNGKVYVIEVNPRSSRTVPYISKVTGVPMVDLACAAAWARSWQIWATAPVCTPTPPMWPSRCLCSALRSSTAWIPSSARDEVHRRGAGHCPQPPRCLLKGLIGAGYTFKTPGPAAAASSP